MENGNEKSAEESIHTTSREGEKFLDQEPKLDLTSSSSIMDKMHYILNINMSLEGKIITSQQKIRDIENKIFEIKGDIMYAVYDEKEIVDEKKKQKYSNEKLRENEVHKRKWNHAAYKVLKAEETKLYYEIHKTKATLDFHKKEMKAIEIALHIKELRMV